VDELRIFVSSPGDVAEERFIVRRVIARLQSEFAGRLRIEPIFWEHEPLAASASFQDQLPRPSTSDIAICILWSRLGTRLPASFTRPDGSRYESGTEFEFEDALAGLRNCGRPHLLVYRKTAPPVLEGEDEAACIERLQQKLALDAFVRRWFHDSADGTLRAAFHPFAAPAELEELVEVHLRKLIARFRPEAVGLPPTAASAWTRGSPFRGLATFEYEHAGIFFGRTNAVGEMLTALRRQNADGRPFLLVLGMSGCGKSSAVRAGLMPLITQPGVIEGIEEWRWLTFRPRDGGADPHGALLDALRRTIEPNAESLDAALDGLAPNARVFLLVDQLEEIFTGERIEAPVRAAFFDLLEHVVRTRKVWVVATLRSDFYPRCAETPQLAALKAGAGQYDLPLPTPAEIGQIIRLPAAVAGLQFETEVESGQRLDEVLRDAAVRSPEALPLLEFALEELYQRRSPGGVLTLAAYRQIGGVEGALARRAESVFAGLSAEQQAALPSVLRALVTVGPDGDESVARRPALLESFTGASRALVDALIDARLCVTELNAEGDPVVTIAHEALLRHWPRVREWAEADRDVLRGRARLALAAARWTQEDRRTEFLLAPGRPLEEAERVLESGVSLQPAERELVIASRARMRRNRRLRMAAVASLAVLAVAASVSAFIATVERDRAATEASTAARTMEFMVSLFAEADPTERRGEEVTVREVLDRGAAEVERGLEDQPAVRASLMTAMGRAYTGLGLHEPAHRLLSTAVEQRERLIGARARPTTEARSALGAVLYMQSRYEEAERIFRQALHDARELAPEGDPLVSQALNGLALTLTQQGRDAEAEALYREALVIDERLHGRRHLDTARTIKGLAMSLYFAGRYAEAELRLREALDLHRELLGPSHVRVAECENDLGGLYYQMGRYADASRQFELALATYTRVLGPDHPDLAAVENNIGRSLLMDGRIEQAEPRLRAALELDRRSKPPGHDDFALPLNSLAMIEMHRGNLEAAETYLDEALEIVRRHDHWLLDQVLLNRAVLDILRGHLEEARDVLTESRAALESQYPLATMPEERWRYALHDSASALLLIGEKRFSEAEALLVGAREAIDARFPTGGYYPELVLDRLVMLYEAWGKPELAARYRADRERTSARRS